MPAITTPSDTAASAAMCKNAPRTFRSSWRPRRNSSAVSVFTATPTAATTITGSGAAGVG